MLRLRRARWSRARLIGVLAVVIGSLTTTGISVGWWWTDLQARHTAHRLADRATHEWATAPAPVSGGPASADRTGPADGTGPTAGRRPAAVDGSVIAVVRAPRLGADWRMPVQLGTGTQVLREGLGLYAGSPRPGSIGNVALAGHRTTWGAPLRHLNRMRAGDRISIWTAQGRYDYRVTSQGVTTPDDTSVIQPAVAGGTAMLTMTTCTPEFSARQRLWIHAVLVSGTPYSAGSSATTGSTGNAGSTGTAGGSASTGSASAGRAIEPVGGSAGRR